MAVVRHVIQEFDLQLDVLHNDSTTNSYFGAYSDAAQESTQRGMFTPANTYGHGVSPTIAGRAERGDLKVA